MDFVILVFGRERKMLFCVTDLILYEHQFNCTVISFVVEECLGKKLIKVQTLMQALLTWGKQPSTY